MEGIWRELGWKWKLFLMCLRICVDREQEETYYLIKSTVTYLLYGYTQILL